MDADERRGRRVGQTVVGIDCDLIVDEESLHEVFSEAVGFPGFYGRNMNAWIDCMGYLDDPEAGMTSVHVDDGEVVVLQLQRASALRERSRALFDSIVECSAFVNHARLEKGYPAILAVAFYP